MSHRILVRERPRLTQRERSGALRLRILQATLSCIVEVGHERTSTALVAERAGVSRGALLHHFPLKLDLDIAAAEHAVAITSCEIELAAGSLPSTGGDRRHAITAICSILESGSMQALHVLAIAARTRPELAQGIAGSLACLERELEGFAMRALRADPTRLEEVALALATLEVARGCALGLMLAADPRPRDQVLDRWTTAVDHALNPSMKDFV